jgi:hypothetical protein
MLTLVCDSFYWSTPRGEKLIFNVITATPNVDSGVRRRIPRRHDDDDVGNQDSTKLETITTNYEIVRSTEQRELEDNLDKHLADVQAEFKSVYRGMGGMWHNIEVLNKCTPYYDHHIQGLVDGVKRMHNRLIEVDDASMRVEDKLEDLQDLLIKRPGLSLSLS